jgi:enterochelin esterase-like enzyme
MNETMKTLRSVDLGNERSIWVVEPRQPAAARRVVIFLDAEFYRDRMQTVATLDGMLAAGAIDDAWFVFVSAQSAEARWRECPCHPPFARFLAEELLVWLGEQCPRIAGVTEKILVGLSYTGLAAAFVALHAPGVFQKVISQSGSFWWNDGWLIDAYAALPAPLPTAFYLEVGSRETQENLQHHEDVFQKTSQLESVRHFRDTLRATGHRLQYLEFDGSHDYAAWKKTLPAALTWALPPR